MQEAVVQVKTLHSLSISDKIKTLKEWQANPWYGWALVTLNSCKFQAEQFAKVPPKDIEALSQREQAIGEVNGLTRFNYEVESVLSALIQDLEDEKKPTQEQEQQSEDK